VFGERERSRFEQIFPQYQTLLFDKASHFFAEHKGERIAEAVVGFVTPSQAELWQDFFMIRLQVRRLEQC
jgi:hypothetical protein